jgi:hypothetical protein
LRDNPRRGDAASTTSIRIDDRECLYLEDGRSGPGWYTCLMGQPILRIDDLAIARRWLPVLEAIRLGDRRQG